MDELYPHQVKALDELNNGSILWGGVGTGKSRVAMAYYMKHENPKDIYIITTAKKRDELDWEGEAVKYGIYKSKETSVGGILTVDSWNNIGKYVGVRDAFFVFDEQRLVGSGAWTKSFIKIARYNRWILLSATPGDTWLDYIPVFVANGHYKNRTAFKQEHVIYSSYSKFPKVERYVGAGKLVRLRNQILVEMPYLRHTTRKIEYVPVDYDAESLHRVMVKRWNIYEDRPLRNVAEMFGVMRRVANSDPSRLDAVKCLMKKHPKLIVFYNFDYELDALRTLSLPNDSSIPDGKAGTSTNSPDGLKTEPGGSLVDPTDQCDTPTTPHSKTRTDKWNTKPITGTPVAEWNGHKHEPIPDTDRWVYLVQYVAGSEGWNCVDTDAMVMYSPTYSYKNWHQAFGRIDRLNTPFFDLYYYVLLSKAPIDRAVMKALESKQNFNEASYGSNL